MLTNGKKPPTKTSEDRAYFLRRIAGVEGDDTGKSKNDAITKLFNAAGSVSAVKYHAEAAKCRAEAARLREELAQLERQLQPAAGVPIPNVFPARVTERGFVLSRYCESSDYGILPV